MTHMQEINILTLCLLHWVHIWHARYIPCCFMHSCADISNTKLCIKIFVLVIALIFCVSVKH